jgi:hypothetical protein
VDQPHRGLSTVDDGDSRDHGPRLLPGRGHLTLEGSKVPNRAGLLAPGWRPSSVAGPTSSPHSGGPASGNESGTAATARLLALTTRAVRAVGGEAVVADWHDRRVQLDDAPVPACHLVLLLSSTPMTPQWAPEREGRTSRWERTTGPEQHRCGCLAWL